MTLSDVLNIPCGDCTRVYKINIYICVCKQIQVCIYICVYIHVTIGKYKGMRNIGQARVRPRQKSHKANILGRHALDEHFGCS